MHEKVPSGLKAAGRALWRSIVAEFDLHAAERFQLEVLCQTVDDRDRLRVELAGSAVIVAGHAGQPRAHPLIAQIAALDKVIDLYVMALGLPIAGEEKGRRRSGSAKVSAVAAGQRSARRRKGLFPSVENNTTSEGER